MQLPPLEIIDLMIDGGAVAKYDGKIVFLDSGIPGAIVKAEVVKDTKKIIHAMVVEELQSSPHFVTSTCEHSPLCGGCVWQHITPEFQRSWKEKRIQETLQRIGDVSIPVLPIIHSENTQRTHMSYSFGLDDKEQPALGLRQRNSHTIVPVPFCQMQPEAEPILSALRTIFLTNEQLAVWSQEGGYLRSAVIHTPTYQHSDQKKQCVIELIVAPDSSMTHKKTAQLLRTLLTDTPATGVLLSERKGKSLLAQGERTLYSAGVTELYESYPAICDGTPFVFSPATFMQTNTVIANEMVKKVLSLAHAQEFTNIADLYCGVGVFGIGLALSTTPATTLFGADIQEKAGQYAYKNAQFLSVPHHNFITGHFDRSLKSITFTPDVIIVDPPRAGLDAATIEFLLQSRAKTLIYISCDVATQARDIKLLQSVWTAQEAQPFDMFFATPHIENIVFLTKS